MPRPVLGIRGTPINPLLLGFRLERGRWFRPQRLVWGLVLLLTCLGEARAQTGMISLINEAFADANADGIPDHLGEAVTVRGVLISDPISLNGSSLVNLQDDSGGVILFTRQQGLLLGKVRRGDRIRASGEVTLYKGNRELVLSGVSKEGAGVLPTPRVVRAVDLVGHRYSGELVRVTGTLKVGPGFLTKKEPVILQDSSGQIPVLVSARLFTSSEFLERFQQGGQVQVVGIAGQAKEAATQSLDFRLIPRDADDFEFATIPPYREIVLIAGFLFLFALVWVARSRRRLADQRVRELSYESKRAAEERDRFFTLSLDLLCIAGRNGYFRRLNPAFTQNLGWSIEELLGRRCLSFVYPDDRAATIRHFANLAGGVSHAQFENRCLCRDGSWRVLSWKAVLQPDGTIYAAARDVTQQRKTETELRLLNEQLEQRVTERTAEVRQALATLDATEDAAFIFEPETLRFSYVNQGATRQLGYARAELLMKTLLHIEPNLDEVKFRQIIAPMMQGETHALQFTTVHRHKNGHEVPVEINLQYVTIAGERPRFIALARDITERTKTERAAQRSQRLESLGTLAGGIAHDLNNALAPILMGVDLLRSQYPNAAGILDMCQSSAQRGAAMARQLLTFARGADGKRVSIQPSHMLRDMANIIHSTFPKNINLLEKWDANLPTVSGDATQISQVLLNLCVNARDAMPDGGTLELEARSVEVDEAFAQATPGARPGNYVMLRVCDTGAGIAPDILDQIFDPFFTTKGPDKGTGLGLSTVMGIVKSHGGCLKVYSQPRQGSTFTVYLPTDCTKNIVSPTSKAAVKFHGRGETILFVDDEVAVREVARAVFGRLNLKLVTASDGVEGLTYAALHQTSMRAIITDVHMPNMGGLAFVRAIRETLPDIPIIVTSGRLENKDLDELKRLNVHAILDKPFLESELAAALKQVLANEVQLTA